LIKWMKH